MSARSDKVLAAYRPACRGRLWRMVLPVSFALLVAHAPSTRACQPPMPGVRMPTESELRKRYAEEADSIIVARATDRGDNGKENATVADGEGWAALEVLHTFKGTGRKRVRYRLGGCGYGGTRGSHVPTDKYALLFLKGDFVFYGVMLPAGRDVRRIAEEALHGGSQTPVPW